MSRVGERMFRALRTVAVVREAVTRDFGLKKKLIVKPTVPAKLPLTQSPN